MNSSFIKVASNPDCTPEDFNNALYQITRGFDVTELYARQQKSGGTIIPFNVVQASDTAGALGDLVIDYSKDAAVSIIADEHATMLYYCADDNDVTHFDSSSRGRHTALAARLAKAIFQSGPRDRTPIYRGNPFANQPMAAPQYVHALAEPGRRENKLCMFFCLMYCDLRMGIDAYDHTGAVSALCQMDNREFAAALEKLLSNLRAARPESGAT